MKFISAFQGIDAVVVGADRIVKNGDVANKIGTYQIAGEYDSTIVRKTEKFVLFKASFFINPT